MTVSRQLGGKPFAFKSWSAIEPTFAPGFKCKIRDFNCKIFLHLIPEPEEKASEPLHDLTNDNNMYIPLNVSMIFVSMYVGPLLSIHVSLVVSMLKSYC
jgi:hypothetical protein